jgi:hypothetical protein
MATLVAPEDATTKTIKGQTYKLAGIITVAEYYTHAILAAFDAHSVCTKTKDGKLNVWEPVW